MKQFQEGDRVRVVNNDQNEEYYDIGAEGIVLKAIGDSEVGGCNHVQFDEGAFRYDGEGDSCWWANDCRLELVSRVNKETVH